MAVGWARDGAVQEQIDAQFTPEEYASLTPLLNGIL